jgi:adenylate cyclase class 2
MIEVELKFAVDSLSTVRDQFLKLGAVLESTSRQSDEYLNDPLRDFAKLDMALRIRSDNDQYCLTYKGPNQDATAKIRKEIEMPLMDEAAANQIKGVFEGIGFFSVAKVVKQRANLSLRWLEENVQVCLDDVADVGQFVEVELVVAHQADVEQARRTLFDLAQNVGLSGSIKTSYLQMLLQNRGLL